MIGDIINGGKIDKGKYQKLDKMEQNLMRSLFPYFGKDIDEVDDNEAFADRWDVIRGELQSGNDSKALKMEAKKYLLFALNTGRISRTAYNNMLLDLGL